MSEILGGLAVNGKLIVIGENIEGNPLFMIPTYDLQVEPERRMPFLPGAMSG